MKSFKETTAAGEAYIGKKGQPIKRPPPKYVDEVDILVCHCLQLHCIAKGGDSGVTCPIRCMNSRTKKRYGMDTSNGRSSCLCPICRCDCNRAWKVSFIIYVYFNSNNIFYRLVHSTA